VQPDKNFKGEPNKKAGMPVYTTVQWVGPMPAIGAYVDVFSHRQKLSFTVGQDDMKTFFMCMMQTPTSALARGQQRGVPQFAAACRQLKTLAEAQNIPWAPASNDWNVVQAEAAHFKTSQMIVQRDLAHYRITRASLSDETVFAKIEPLEQIDVPRCYSGKITLPLPVKQMPKKQDGTPLTVGELAGRVVCLSNFVLECFIDPKYGPELSVRMWARVSAPEWPDQPASAGFVRERDAKAEAE
jgi:hypothetical protein